jgi:hypothetical protein
MYYLALRLPWNVIIVYRYPFETIADALITRAALLPSTFDVVPEDEIDLDKAYLIPFKEIPFREEVS